MKHLNTPQAAHPDVAYAGLIHEAQQSGDRLKYRNGYRYRLICPDRLYFHHAPLVTLRKTSWKSALREWEWFMSGSNNINDLHPSVRHWWHPWADEYGYVRYNYSKQFRHYDGSSFRPGFNQLAAFVDGIKTHPHSSRHLMTTWHAEEMYAKDCPITNCHGTDIQAFVTNGRLDLHMTQRSADLVCGVQHNWIQYWAFLLWLAHTTGNTPGAFVWSGNDVHLYEVHVPVAEKIVWYARTQDIIKTPNLVYTPTSKVFKADDFRLDGDYSPLITESVEMVK